MLYDENDFALSSVVTFVRSGPNGRAMVIFYIFIIIIMEFGQHLRAIFAVGVLQVGIRHKCSMEILQNHWKGFMISKDPYQNYGVLVMMLCVFFTRIHSVETPVWYAPSGIYCTERPCEFSTPSAEVRLAVGRGQPLFTLDLPMFALSLE